MNQNELTETVMMISNWKNPLVSKIFIWKKIGALGVNMKKVAVHASNQ